MIGQILSIAFTLVVVSAVIAAVAMFGVVGLVTGLSNGLQRAAERVLYGSKGSGKTQIAALPKPDYEAIVAMEKELGWEPLPEHVKRALASHGSVPALTSIEKTVLERIKRSDNEMKYLCTMGNVNQPAWKMKAVSQTREEWIRGCGDPDCLNWESTDVMDGAGNVIHDIHQHRPHPSRGRP